jgi:hypothetical protein
MRYLRITNYFFDDFFAGVFVAVVDFFLSTDFAADFAADALAVLPDALPDGLLEDFDSTLAFAADFAEGLPSVDFASDLTTDLEAGLAADLVVDSEALAGLSLAFLEGSISATLVGFLGARTGSALGELLFGADLAASRIESAGDFTFWGDSLEVSIVCTVL